MSKDAAREWLHEFPVKLACATLFTDLAVHEYFREEVIDEDPNTTTDKITKEGLEFLKFRSGARVARKSKGDSTATGDDDVSGFRRSSYMIPVAYPGIVVKAPYLRKLPLVYHCLLVRTGTLFVQNAYKVSRIDTTEPKGQRINSLLGVYNTSYPIYSVRMRMITLLPLRKMANLFVAAVYLPEYSPPECRGNFPAFSFVTEDTAPAYFAICARRRADKGMRTQLVVNRNEAENEDDDSNAGKTLPPTSVWKERRRNDPDWGIPVLHDEHVTPNDTNPMSELIGIVLQLTKRYSTFPTHVKYENQHVKCLKQPGDNADIPISTQYWDSWKEIVTCTLDLPYDLDQTDFIRTILISFLVSRPVVFMQLEAAPLSVLRHIIADIAYHQVFVGVALPWKNAWSLEIGHGHYSQFDDICKRYFGRMFMDMSSRLTPQERDRGACLRRGIRYYYDKFSKLHTKGDYSHMYELLDLTYDVRDHPEFAETLSKEHVLYATLCPWTKQSRWITATWSDYTMSRDVAAQLIDLSRRTIRLLPHKHRKMGDIIDTKDEDDKKQKTKLTTDMPKGSVLFDEELFNQIVCDGKFTTYGGTEIVLADEQIRAVRSLKESPLTMVLGGPGTGKSTLFQVFLQLFGVENVHICCAYNTMASMHGKTSLYSTSIDSANARFTRYADPRRSDVKSKAVCRVLIIDEIGVVSTRHKKMLFNTYTPDILILAGDIDQMKCIGRGEVLRGLMDVFGDNPSVTTTLTIKHRANVGISRVHINNCLEHIKNGRGEQVYGTVDKIARPPISFLRHRSVNSSDHIKDTFAPVFEKFGNDVEFWKNAIVMCRTHKHRRAIMQHIITKSPLTAEIARRRGGMLDRRDLAVGELLKVTSRFKPYERKAPPLVPPELGNGALYRVTRIVDVFLGRQKNSDVVKKILGGYLTKEELAACLDQVEIEDVETTRAPTARHNARRKRARLIVLDDGETSFILTDKTMECYERGNVVTVASVQGGQAKNIIIFLTPPSTQGGVNIGAFTEERSMIYTAASRSRERIIIIGTKAMLGEISRRTERARRNLFTALIRQFAGMHPFEQKEEETKNYRLPIY
jgi:hypothetical protein